MHADSNSTLFHKSEFAHKLPQSIFSVKSFFAAERDKFTQQTYKNEYLHSNYTYFTINSFQKHQYVLVCSENTSNFLRFSQVLFSRFHAKDQTPMVFNKRIQCVRSFYLSLLHTVPSQKNRIKLLHAAYPQIASLLQVSFKFRCKSPILTDTTLVCCFIVTVKRKDASANIKFSSKNRE